MAKGDQGPPRGREATPKAPGASGSEPSPASPAGQGDPQSPGPDPAGASTTQDGRRPSAAEVAKVPKASAIDRWGDLPIQAREVFRTEGGGDLPPQYRDWIDAYYKKLLRQP